MTRKFDVIVIGTGSAASGVAARCQKAGRRVAVIDSRPFGGTCALRGCDPKKVLVGAAEAIDWNRRMQDKGVRAQHSAPKDSDALPSCVQRKLQYGDDRTPDGGGTFQEGSWDSASDITREKTLALDPATLKRWGDEFVSKWWWILQRRSYDVGHILENGIFGGWAAGDLWGSDIRNRSEALVVHEWGTFTSVANERGEPVQWSQWISASKSAVNVGKTRTGSESRSGESNVHLSCTHVNTGRIRLYHRPVLLT
jgi:hypothetical protein